MYACLLAGWENIGQLLTVLLIFILVLALTYFTTRFAASAVKQRQSCHNFEIIETFQLTQNKYMAVVRCGKKYLAIAVTKDSVTRLCELDESELDLTEIQETSGKLEFKDFMDQAKKVLKKGGKRDER
ncbi:MAG: flagellar biosynthetic protein FliO [Lachnospiraceae bacterium]|nr:flagellar biosynthetic protein FliO [Lachnospiraceae bacterium]